MESFSVTSDEYIHPAGGNMGCQPLSYTSKELEYNHLGRVVSDPYLWIVSVLLVYHQHTVIVSFNDEYIHPGNMAWWCQPLYY